MTYEVGQKLVAITPAYRSGQPPHVQDIIITKVAKKWATYADARLPDHRHLGGRFSMVTGRIDGGAYSSNAGRVHLDRATYEDQAKLDEAWKERVRRISQVWGRPVNVDWSHIGALDVVIRAIDMAPDED